MNEENKKLETAGNIRRNPERFIFYETETAEQIRGTPEKTTSLNMEKKRNIRSGIILRSAKTSRPDLEYQR